MSTPRRIGLIFDTVHGYGRAIWRGILEYARRQGGWEVDLRRDEPLDPMLDLRRWGGDGLIVQYAGETMGAELRDAGLPVVNVATRILPAPFPSVVADDRAVGRFAIDHFLDLGLRRVGFVGSPRLTCAEVRGRAFVEQARAAGLEVHTYRLGEAPGEAPSNYAQDRRALTRWLAGLPKPIGLLCCHDVRGRRLINLCRELNVRVPDEVAVVGVDNDEPACELAQVPLSSVRPDAERVGYEAARLLDALMAGEAPPAEPIRIPPLEVVRRRSSDTLAIEDPVVVEALRHIRADGAVAGGVEALARKVCVSRRVLERRFRQWLNRSPLEEIRRTRLERARRLLRETELSIGVVARRVGFADGKSFATVFREATDLTPTEYRRRHQR